MIPNCNLCLFEQGYCGQYESECLKFQPIFRKTKAAWERDTYHLYRGQPKITIKNTVKKQESIDYMVLIKLVVFLILGIIILKVAFG
jgi:hypothetical protein